MKNGKKEMLNRKVFTNHGETLLVLGMAARSGHCPFLRIDLAKGGQPIYGELDPQTFMHAAKSGLPTGIPLIPRQRSESSKSKAIDYVGLRGVATVTIYE